MKRQQQWLAALSLLGLLSATQAAVAADRGDEVAQPVVRKRGLMRDIIQVITEGGLPDPVTVLQTTTMLATVTVPAPDIAAAVINDTAAPVALGAAAPAAPAVVGAAAGVPAAACAGALTITQTVTVQSCLAGGIGAAAPIDTGVALAVPTAAPIAAAPGIDAAATGPRGGIGVQIVQLPQTAATTLVVPQAPPPPIQPILPPGSGIVEGSVAGKLTLNRRTCVPRKTGRHLAWLHLASPCGMLTCERRSLSAPAAGRNRCPSECRPQHAAAAAWCGRYPCTASRSS